MYKVFFNDRTIFLTDEFLKNFRDKNGLFYKYTDTDDLKELIGLFNHLKKIRALYVFHNDIDFLRDSFRSCFRCIDAAGGLIKNEKGQFLFIKRRGKWDLPKGKLDEGESVKKAAIREAKEECGLNDLRIVSPMLSTYHTYTLHEDLVLKKTYWFEMEYSGKAEPVPQTEEDITEIKWFEKDNLHEITENTYLAVLDVMRYANLISMDGRK